MDNDKIFEEILQGFGDIVLTNRSPRFAWLPTKVYSRKHYRDGFVWLDYVYLDSTDGRSYRLSIDIPEFTKGTVTIKRPKPY